MGFLDLARKRRSIRAFAPEPVTDEQLDQILEAARWAPTAGNLQAWRVKVLRTSKERELVRRRKDDFVTTAPVVLVFCAFGIVSGQPYGRRGSELYAVQDATIATTQAMLMASELGLGSCWIGAFDEREVGRSLKLPNGLRPVVILPIGHPAEGPEPPARFEMNQFEL